MTKTEMTLLLLTLAQISTAFNFDGTFPKEEPNPYGCFTPNSNPAICLSLYSCPSILKIFLNSPGSAEDERFLQNSYCVNGFGIPPYVCCSNEDRFTDNERKHTGNENIFSDIRARPKELRSRYKEERNLLARPEECIEKSSAKFYGTNLLTTTDYRWLAVLERDLKSAFDEVHFDPLCIGSLISHRYILSSAQCVQGRSFKRAGKIIKARLGVYDVNGAILCTGRYCLNPAEIEKITVHENYNSGLKLNDISLIRLREEVIYTENIAPICLPSAVGFNRSQTTGDVFVAGWGENPEAVKDYKASQSLWIMDQSECTEKYKGLTNISKDHICTSFQNSNKCLLAFGTPLIRLYNGKWLIEGIISFDATHCGEGDSMPSVYTRASAYEDWIRNNIEE